MKKKSTFFLMFGIVLLVCTIILLQLDLASSIDYYSISISKLLSSKLLKIILLFITNIMTIIGIVIILLVTIFLLRKENAIKEIKLFIISILSTLLVVNLVKIIFRRSRPIDMLLSASGYSFPSAHSSISTVVYGYLILLIRKYYKGKYKNLYIFLCILLITLTGLSRIYFNVHYITDVLAGLGLGLIILCISNHYLKKLTK